MRLVKRSVVLALTARKARSASSTGAARVSSTESVGQFETFLCNTGTWWSGYNEPAGPVDSTIVDAGGGTGEITSVKYTISLAGGVGVMKVHKVNGCVTGRSSNELSGSFHIGW